MIDRHMQGWVHSTPDPRNQEYRIAKLLDTAKPPQTREWTPGPILDQGDTPHCVAFGSDDFLACSPIVNAIINPDDLYAACQRVDGIRGAHDGTTVHAAMKVLKGDGRVAAYYWANTEDEVRAWISAKGPVVIGVDWYDSFFTPTKAGYLTWPDSAQIAGGHCVLLTGYDAHRHSYRLQNSWGTTWAQRGMAWLRGEHLERLLADGGEAATAVEVLEP